MDIIIFPILLIIIMVILVLIGFSQANSKNNQREYINPSILTGGLIFIIFMSLFLFFIFGISSSGFNIASFVPIFGGAWIPIWIAISNQKKKESKSVTGTDVINGFDSQRDEIKSLRFCPNCGSQYHPIDRYCEMCGQIL